jgi:putative lipoic acid-binding regulatory protein
MMVLLLADMLASVSRIMIDARAEKKSMSRFPRSQNAKIMGSWGKEVRDKLRPQLVSRHDSRRAVA